MQEKVNRRRSERVVLRIPVGITAEDEFRKQFQTQAETQVVNAHGGLLRMRQHLYEGQSFLASNPQNHREISCRVVRIEDDGLEFYKIAFEFDRPVADFWPVSFPPADWVTPQVDQKQLI